MRTLLALLTGISLGVIVMACGSSGQDVPSTARTASSTVATSATTTSTSRVTTPNGYLNDGDNDPSSDEDADNRNGKTVDEDSDYPEDHMHPENDRYHDKDEQTIVTANSPASASETRAVAALLKRYYAAAAAADGAKACTMIYSTIAEAVPEDYGQPPGPTYMRGTSCAAVMTLLFKHRHSELTPAFKVTGVRVKGNQGIALFGSATMPASEINVRRERGVWKIDGLLGGPLV